MTCLAHEQLDVCCSKLEILQDALEFIVVDIKIRTDYTPKSIRDVILRYAEEALEKIR